MKSSMVSRALASGEAGVVAISKFTGNPYRDVRNFGIRILGSDASAAGAARGNLAMSTFGPMELRERLHMFLTRFGYFADFYIYPALIPLLAAAGMMIGPSGTARWLAIFLACLALWTLLEYLLHRFMFHHLPYIRDMHEEHHQHEKGFVGTPIWISLVAHLFLGFLPVYLVAGFADASAASSGLMLGYLWYVSVHHMVHHWHPAHSTYLYNLKRRHALHHHHDQDRNFGVTTGFWDHVFRTDDVAA